MMKNNTINYNCLPIFMAVYMSVNMRIKYVKLAISPRSKSTQGNALSIAIGILFKVFGPSLFISAKG